jgi:hypothetical protein
MERQRALGQRCTERQSRPYGPHGRIFVGHGIAKVDEEFVAVVVRDVPRKGRHDIFARRVESLHNALKIIRVQPLHAHGED